MTGSMMALFVITSILTIIQIILSIIYNLFNKRKTNPPQILLYNGKRMLLGFIGLIFSLSLSYFFYFRFFYSDDVSISDSVNLKYFGEPQISYDGDTPIYTLSNSAVEIVTITNDTSELSFEPEKISLNFKNQGYNNIKYYKSKGIDVFFNDSKNNLMWLYIYDDSNKLYFTSVIIRRFNPLLKFTLDRFIDYIEISEP